MLRVYTRYQEKVNSLWITPNTYSMIYTLPWVTPGTPANSVIVTAINSSNWDKRESSTWVCKQLCEGLHLRLDYNQSRTIPGKNCRLLCMMLLILHKFNSSEYLVVSESWVPRDNKETTEMCHKKCILILSAWNSTPQSVLSDVLELTR